MVTEVTLYPPTHPHPTHPPTHPLPQEMTFKDSLDPEGLLRFSHTDLTSPTKGEPGWPRLQVENRVYTSAAFRKLHVELAARSDGLCVLHCVMYPWIDFPLPIFSLDLVGSPAGVSLAIVDPGPATLDRALPAPYAAAVTALQEKYGVTSNRAAPEWGKGIFSDACVLMRPADGAELRSFLLYALALHRSHLQFAANMSAGRPGPHKPRAQGARSTRAAHKRYVEAQRANDKTRRVLAAAFGDAYAEKYMRTMMFDVEDL